MLKTKARFASKENIEAVREILQRQMKTWAFARVIAAHKHHMSRDM